MAKKKIMSVFGTRPEATKMLPLVLHLNRCADVESFESLVCVTGQHRELLDTLLRRYGVTPDYDLNLMRSGQSLTELTARALTGLSEIFAKVNPDWVLVHGDTTTTLSASLAAFYNQIRIGHVEAGLRTYDKYQPFPEEMNRKLTTALADVHFAPTALAREQLLKEAIPDEKILVTGNTAIDFLRYTINAQHVFENPHLADVSQKPFILVTAHRRENLGEPLRNIGRALMTIVERHPEMHIVLPMHPNPLVRETLKTCTHPRILLTESLEPWDLQNLMAKCRLVLTDSGGLQEEAPALKKPVVVLREVTERPEGIQTGALVLGGTDTERIVGLVDALLGDSAMYRKMAEAENPFGDGKAAERIVGWLQHHPL